MSIPLVTPQENYPDLAKAVGIKDLFFKREDLHPYGSHKGRSVPVMIDRYVKSAKREFVISSSGNAALAAALYIKEINSKSNKSAAPNSLDIFVGNHITPHKLEKLKTLQDENIHVLIKERPLQAATMAAEKGTINLRQSIDDSALIGYEALGRELGLIKGIGAIFIGTSSGTTAQALATYFAKGDGPTQIHIVQTSSCHPLADDIEIFDGRNEDSIADAIVDRTAMRRSKLIPLIKNSGGNAWVATNDDITAARDLVMKNTDIDISTNSALSVVGMTQASYRGWKIDGTVVCMICGE